MLTRFWLFLWLICCGSVAFSAPYSALSKAELAKVEKIWALVEKKQFSEALVQAQKIRRPELTTLVLWQQYSTPYFRNSYHDIIQFIAEHPGLPKESQLRKQAERSIPLQTDSATIQRIFDQNPPQTAHGKYLLATAYLKDNQRSELAIPLLREAWVARNMDKKTEADFAKRYRKYLRREDFNARMSRLLWEGKTSAASRLLHYTDKNHRRLFAARIALQSKTRGVDQAVRAVPATLRQDHGLLYDRSYFRLKRKRYKGAYDVIKEVTPVEYQDKWWQLKNRLIREMIEIKSYKRAYQLAKTHGLEGGSRDYADAQWLAGWLSLRFLNQPKEAYPYFYQMFKQVKYPISKSRAAYWAGRAAEGNHNMEVATKWYNIAAKYPTRFYGQLAFAKLRLGQRPRIRPFPSSTTEDRNWFKRQEMREMVYLLVDLNEITLARHFVKQLIANAHTPGQMALISEIGYDTGHPQISIEASKEALRQGVVLSKTGYPTLSELQLPPRESPLIYGIIRQESLFNPKARSSANAMGLMQLIPGTAKKMSRRINQRYSSKRVIADPAYNVALGRSYINHLLAHYDHTHILAISAYNAGPGNTGRWIRNFGDPRHHTLLEQSIDWIERISFTETRNYVQRVLENKNSYQIMMGQDLTIERDVFTEVK